MRKSKPHTNKLLKCGDCNWFYTIDADFGNTCEIRYSCKPSDRACVDFEIAEFSATFLRARDATIKKINTIVENGKFNIDSTLINEINTYYIVSKFDPEKQRMVKRIPETISISSLKKLIRLLEECQADRDRVTSIYVSISGIKNALTGIRATAESYMYDKYMKEMSGFKNDGLRNMTLRSVFRELFSKMDAATHILDMSQAILANLNSTYFILKEISNLCGTIISSERRR